MFFRSWASFDTTFLMNCGWGKPSLTPHALILWLGVSKCYAPCNILLLLQIIFWCQLNFMEIKVDINLATLSFFWPPSDFSGHYQIRHSVGLSVLNKAPLSRGREWLVPIWPSSSVGWCSFFGRVFQPRRGQHRFGSHLRNNSKLVFPKVECCPRPYLISTCQTYPRSLATST